MEFIVLVIPESDSMKGLYLFIHYGDKPCKTKEQDFAEEFQSLLVLVFNIKCLCQT